MGSTALAAAVAYTGKAAYISSKEQSQRTTLKSQSPKQFHIPGTIAS